MKFKGSREAPEVDPASVPTLRALALELNRHPSWIAAIGVRPKSDSSFDQQAALAQAFAAVELLRGYALRDGVAETIGWKAVSTQPGVWANGFGALLFVQPEAPAPGAPAPSEGTPPAAAPAGGAPPAAAPTPAPPPAGSTPPVAPAAPTGTAPSPDPAPSSSGAPPSPTPPGSGAPPKMEDTPKP
jgi:hypothetical protein